VACRTCSILVAVTLFSLVTSALAQQSNSTQQRPADKPALAASPSGSHGFQITSKLVVLDVVVTDKKGQLVNNLAKDDFQVYEDKVPQTIGAFDVQQSPLTPAKVAINSTYELDKLEPDAPANILVLDEIATRFEDRAFARYSIEQYLNAQGDTLLQPTMLVAVDMQHLLVLRDYTTSKKQILSALDHHHAASNSLQMESKKSWNEAQYNATFNWLTVVAEATSGHPGHKNIIWIGSGLPTILWSYLPSDAEKLRSAIEICTNMLRDARVTLYTVDPVGVSGEPESVDLFEGGESADPFGGQVEFNAMAKATGGRAFFGRNDVDHLIESSVQAGANFYTLSYTPTSASDDSKAFRRIKVVMNDPNLRATTREGYYAKTPALQLDENDRDKSANSMRLDLSLAGQSMMVYDAVPITVTRDLASPDSFHIYVKASNVPWRSAGPHLFAADITVLVESFDKKDKLLNHTSQVHAMKLPSNSEGTALESSAVKMMASISTQAPAARLRFVVLVNGTGKLGAVNLFLVDKKALNDSTP
jgi:VWFA-related protein